MFSFSHLMISSLFALSVAQYSKCLMCIQDVPVLLPNTPIQSYHLGTKLEWTCGEIDATGRAGGFTPEECIIAQQIAHACLCEHPTPTPTPAPILIEPTCQICGKNDIIGNPTKVVTTMIGQNTCEDLITASRQGYFPSNMCPEFATYNIPQECGCSTAKTTAPTMAPTTTHKSLPIPLACFSNHNKVHVQNKGLVPMHELKIGDMVRVEDGVRIKEENDNSDSHKFSRIYSFGHYNVDAVTEYLQIYTEVLPHDPLEITSQHMVFVHQRGAVPAEAVTLGDQLITTTTKTTAKTNSYENDYSSSMMRRATVTKISKVRRMGAFAPFTESGTLVVNGVLASSYISMLPHHEQHNHSDGGFHSSSPFCLSMHWLAHASQAPHRIVCKLLRGKNSNSFCDSETYTPEGVSNWVNGPFVFAKWFMNQNTTVQTMMGIPLALVWIGFSFLELMIFNSIINNKVIGFARLSFMMIVVVGTLFVMLKKTNTIKKVKLA